MTALAKIEPINNFLDICDDIDRMKQMSKKLMETKFYQKIGEEGVFAIAMMAKSINMPVMDGLNGELYYVQGRVGMAAEAMNKRIRMAGHSINLKRLDENGCILIGKRKDTGDTAEISYGIDDMRSAGKNYEKNKKDMFFARALSRLKRILFPDVACKIYEKSELDEMKEDEIQNFKGQTVDVKPLYIEKPETITTEQAIELSNLKLKCASQSQENFMDHIKKKYKIEILDDLPADQYESIKRRLTASSLDYQKALAEMNPKVEAVQVEELVSE